VLKPLSGIDEGLETNLRSFFQQDHAEYEILFAVREAHDPAVGIVAALQKEFPSRAARLIFTGEPPYANAKVFSLDRMLAEARYDLLVVENLKIANMVRRAKPVPDPDAPGSYLPNGGRAKSGLNRSISDASWGGFLGILRAKAEDAGRVWIEVDPRHTSDGCENCGHAARENRVAQAEFVCQRCSHRAQADEHAARNVLRAGLALHTLAA